jgi:hypothetical protein
MDDVADDDLVVPRGRARTVAYARDASGDRPALEFLESHVSERQYLQFHQYFQILAELGWLSNPKQFRKEREDIWGFKAGKARIACFSKGRVWFLTHGFMKKRDRWPPEELNRALRIRWEHLVRMNRGGIDR